MKVSTRATPHGRLERRLRRVWKGRWEPYRTSITFRLWHGRFSGCR